MKRKMISRVMKRIVLALKEFQPILSAAKAKDINETDTIIIINNILSGMFGYNQYNEITSEFSIRGTFCDLAIKLEDSVQILIEAKAIGLDLKDNHIKQAVDYAANKGVDWVILTNGIEWMVFKVLFEKPVDKELVFSFNLLNLNHKNKMEMKDLHMLSKEGWQHSTINDYHIQKKALDRFLISATILSNISLCTIRRELRRISPEVKISIAEIKTVISNDIFKREVLEGCRAEEASKKVQRCSHTALRKGKTKLDSPDQTQTECTEENISQDLLPIQEPLKHSETK